LHSNQEITPPSNSNHLRDTTIRATGDVKAALTAIETDLALMPKAPNHGARSSSHVAVGA
jgi:hypothetical protein